MNDETRCLRTARLRLRRWDISDQVDFAALHSDPVVMSDLGGPIDRAASDRKLQRYITTFSEFGFGRWAVENGDGDFVGYVGVLPHAESHPVGPHHEIGWRLAQNYWGLGYATEAAVAALNDIFVTHGLDEVIAYTSPTNLRSQKVMARLHMERDAARDFSVPDDAVGTWSGLVWKTNPLLLRSILSSRCE